MSSCQNITSSVCLSTGSNQPRPALAQCSPAVASCCKGAYVATITTLKIIVATQPTFAFFCRIWLCGL